MEAYSYVSSGGGMVLLLLILGAILIYLLFSKGFWMDKYMRDDNNWKGEDIHPDYLENIPFTLHWNSETLTFSRGSIIP